MASLDFHELAELLNYTRNIRIDPDPIRVEPGWAMYSAVHRVHGSSYPFNIIYLHSRVTNQDVEVASREVFPEKKRMSFMLRLCGFDGRCYVEHLRGLRTCGAPANTCFQFFVTS